MRLLIVFVLLSLTFLDAKPYEENSLSLYTGNPFVMELDASTFNRHIYCEKSLCRNAKFVQFYTYKSKLSQSFVPLFTDIAKSTTSWVEIVQLFTVNCDLDSNKELCAHHGFKKIPLLRYFPVYAQKGSVGQPLTLYTNATVILEELMKMLEKEYSEKYHQHWPIFSQIPNDTCVEELWGAQTLETSHILLMFVENPYDFRTYNLLIQTKKNDSNLIARIVLKGSLISHLLTVYEFPTYMILLRAEKPKYNPYTEKWIFPVSHKKNSMEEKFRKVLGNLDFGFFERYSLRKTYDSHPDDEVSYQTEFKIYRQDVPTKHSKAPSKIMEDNYDGFVVELKMEVAQPNSPVEELSLHDASNYGKPQMQVSNSGLSIYFCRFISLVFSSMIFNFFFY